ncbi:MAG: hypothetical protein JST75_16140 [Bacteroidetes bacterium]|nr:hypothetical protein [Bacteroidota bacterium]
MTEMDNKNSLYEVPVNYFESFADTVMNRIKNADAVLLENEAAIISPIFSGIDKKKSIYSIPENYFDGLPEKILARIKALSSSDASEELAILSPLLSKADKKNPYKAPEGFFSELSENLVSGMKAISFVSHELETLHPLMNDLKNKNTYSVPEEYFNQLPEAILQKIKNQQPARIVSFRKRTAWMKYAVAAAVTGIIFTVGILTFNNKVSTEDPTTGLSKISDQEISNYIDNHDNPLAETANNSTASADFNDNDVSDLLSSVPDNELEQYASNHTSPKDLITN